MMKNDKVLFFSLIEKNKKKKVGKREENRKTHQCSDVCIMIKQFNYPDSR